MKNMRNIIWNVFLITTGSVICAVAVNSILVPKQFLAGGFTGLALLIHYVLPFIPVGAIYFVLNIPVFIFGWLFVGHRFFFYSIAGMLIYSLAVLIPFPEIMIEDRLLNALTAGIITGVGSGILLRSLGSAGGMDILAIIILKKFSVRLGTTSLVSNVLLMLAAVSHLPLDMILYTLIYIYVSAYFVNLVVTGLSQRKAVMIVSSRWQEISSEIMEKMGRGVTVVHGEGGYTGKEQKILYSVITFQELARFKELIRKLDPEAFVVITETLEVMGQNIGNQPHW
ncbi:MAG: YitT family protein [Desulfobacterales bacterium]|jgi:uncharacterized membrane-anchored protein YitT (DUF2179 family)